MSLADIENADYKEWIDAYFLLAFLVNRVEKIKSCLILGKRSEDLVGAIRVCYPDTEIAGEAWEEGQWDLVLVREKQSHDTLRKAWERMTVDGLLVLRMPHAERAYAKEVESAGFAFLFENWPTDTITMVFEPEGKEDDNRGRLQADGGNVAAHPQNAGKRKRHGKRPPQRGAGAAGQA